VPADAERLAAVRAVRELGAGVRAAFDRLATLTATVLDCPIAMVNLVGEDLVTVGRHGQHALPRDETALAATLCSVVVAQDAPLLVADTRHHPEYASHPASTRFGVVAYAGSPVRDSAGRMIGTLCAIARHPRRWSEQDRRALDAIARSLTSEVVLYQGLDHRGRLLDAFDAAPVAVAVTRGANHEVEYVNPVFREVFGNAAIGTPGREALPVLADQDFFAVLDRVLTTGQTYRAHEDAHPLGSSEQRFFDLSCSVIATDVGEPYGVLIVAADVTAQVAARRAVEARADRQEAAARATAAVGRSLDPQIELDALARSVIPALADVCTVYVLDDPVPPGGPPAFPVNVTLVAAAGPPGIMLPSTQQGGLAWSGRTVLTDAIRAGRPVRAATDPDSPPSWAGDLGVGDMWHGAGVHTVVTVPVVASGLVLAVVAFIAFRGSRTSPTEDDMTLLRQIGVRASVAIGHGVAYQRSRDHALALQRSMLTEPPEVPGMQLAVCYRPAGEDAEVGGDWYDAFLLPEGDLAVVIGDVAGHDMAAAASMGQLRSMLRALAVDSGGSPDDVLARLERLATGLRVTNFTTLLYGRIRMTGSHAVLYWAHAGHPPPLLMDRDGTGRLLTGASGMVLGAKPDTTRTCASVTLPPGSTLLLYTDGLTERHGGPDDDVVARCTALVDSDLDDLCDELLAGAPPFDDVALLAVRIADNTDPDNDTDGETGDGDGDGDGDEGDSIGHS
jgi:GAF domain-containing protein